MIGKPAAVPFVATILALGLVGHALTGGVQAAGKKLVARSEWEKWTLLMEADPRFREAAKAHILFDHGKAYGIARKGAEAGHAGLQWMLGFMYQEGQHVPLDLRKAAKWFEAAARQGHPIAKHDYARLLDVGVATERNSGLALRYLKESASAGYPKAMFWMGNLYRLGISVDRDPRKAVEWYRHWDGPRPMAATRWEMRTAHATVLQALRTEDLLPLAEQRRDAGARYELGRRHFSGRNADKDVAKAVKLWSQAAAAGYADAAYAMGVAHVRGVGAPRDLARAYIWFSVALAAAPQHPKRGDWRKSLDYARSRLPPDQLALAKKKAEDNAGRIFARRLRIQVVRGIDFATAANAYLHEDFSRAQQMLDHLRRDRRTPAGDLPEILSTLATLYYYDYNAPEVGIELYEQAADLGSDVAWRQMALHLVRHGWQSRKASDYLAKAARSGDPRSLHSLGIRYLNGSGVERDADRAVELFRRAADKGYPAATGSLATMYFQGKGVSRSTEKAVGYWREAASLGDENAMITLGVLHYLGQYVDRDLVEAYRWYTMAGVFLGSLHLSDKSVEEVGKLDEDEIERSYLRSPAVMRHFLETKMSAEAFARATTILREGGIAH